MAGYSTKVDGQVIPASHINAVQTGLDNIALSITAPQYGAYDDDTHETENTTIITNAINDVISAGGGTVLVPEGTFRHNGYTNTSAGPYRVIIQGTSKYGSILKNVGTGDNLSFAPTPDSSSNADIAIRNLTIKGGSGTDSGLYFKNVHWINLENLYITLNGEHGVELDTAYQFIADNVYCDRNSQSSSNSFDGFNIAATTHAARFINCSTYGAGNSHRRGLFATGATNGVWIFGGAFEQSLTEEIRISGQSAVVIHGAYVEQSSVVDNAWIGVNINQAYGIDIAGLYINGNNDASNKPLYGMQINDVTGGDVRACSFSGVVNGIRPIASCKDVHIGRQMMGTGVTNIVDYTAVRTEMQIDPQYAASKNFEVFHALTGGASGYHRLHRRHDTTTGLSNLAGDVIWIAEPTVGSPMFYICTTAGSPGTLTPAGQVGPLTSVASTPSFVGQVAVTGGHAYMATGTSSSADWKQIDN